MKEQLKSILVLVCVCAVVAILMAITNQITAPIIQKNEAAAADKALLEVLPEGKNFQKVDLSSYTLPATVVEGYTEDGGGCVVTLETAGYSAGLRIMCGITADGHVSGTCCLASSETLGYEKTYGDTLKGATADTVTGIDTVAGATKTTTAYKNAVKDALNAAIILGGGSVDIRTEEEILRDNLTSALPSGGETFTPVFISEVLEKVDGIYKAENGKGYVCTVGEQFIGLDEAGKTVSDCDATLAAAVEADLATQLAATYTELDLSAYENLPAHLVKASVSSGGNYLMELQAAGFGINGDEYFNPSGEYIRIRLSISADGKIINCLTVSQKETDGIGSACADRSFYTQFNGKEEGNYKEIDGISGATYTTNGYKTAIGKAFAALQILKGGENA